MWRTRLAILVMLLGVTLLLGLIGGLLLPRLSGLRGGRVTIPSTATVLQQIQTISQLATVKYVLEKVVVLEDVRWYGENRVLMLAHGIVKAGVDLEDLKEEHVRISGRSIAIKLPRVTILDVYLDDQKTRVIDRTTGVFRSFDKDLEQTARRQAVDDVRRAARLNGIEEDAKERAKEKLGGLLRLLGFESVRIED